MDSSSITKLEFTSDMFKGSKEPKRLHLSYKILLFVFDLHHLRTRTDSADRLEQVFDPEYLGSPYFDSKESDYLRKLKFHSTSHHTTCRKKEQENDENVALGELIRNHIAERVMRRKDVRARTKKSDAAVASPTSKILPDANGNQVQSTESESESRVGEKDRESHTSMGSSLEQTIDFRVCAAHDLAPLLAKAFGINERSLVRHKKFINLVAKVGLDFPYEDDNAIKIVESVIQRVCVMAHRTAKK
jgi:hypothetical protein